jgi:hypothetical protein
VTAVHLCKILDEGRYDETVSYLSTIELVSTKKRCHSVSTSINHVEHREDSGKTYTKGGTQRYRLNSKSVLVGILLVKGKKFNFFAKENLNMFIFRTFK